MAVHLESRSQAQRLRRTPRRVAARSRRSTDSKALADPRIDSAERRSRKVFGQHDVFAERSAEDQSAGVRIASQRADLVDGYFDRATPGERAMSDPKRLSEQLDARAVDDLNDESVDQAQHGEHHRRAVDGLELTLPRSDKRKHDDEP